MQYVAEASRWIKAVEPAWVSAGASLVAAIFASVFVFRWYLLRRDLRGSGAAIIAFLGDHAEGPHVLKGTSKVGSLVEHNDEAIYFEAGDENYYLCLRDLERLHGMGYVYRKEHQYQLSSLGRLLLERHDNARLLAKGVARAKRGISCFRCFGGLWFRCRCEKYWVTWLFKISLPFTVGRWLTMRKAARHD